MRPHTAPPAYRDEYGTDHRADAAAMTRARYGPMPLLEAERRRVRAAAFHKKVQAGTAADDETLLAAALARLAAERRAA